MNNLLKLPAKKTQSRYSLSVKDNVVKRGGHDTGDPTTLNTISTTHIFRQQR